MTSVLLVDDTADEREMYAEYLESVGYQPLQASNAVEGFQIAVERAPQIIVTDLVLRGGEDGFAFIARLRATPSVRRIPVIVLSGRVYQGDRTRADEAGCDLFLPKPCLPSELEAEIRAAIARASGGRGRGRLRAAKAALDPDAALQPPRQGPVRARHK